MSDGIETCKGDPCAVAEALRNSASNLKIHVVGYGVDAEARAQLQCVAQKGGGAYFDVDDTACAVRSADRSRRKHYHRQGNRRRGSEGREHLDHDSVADRRSGYDQINLADWATQAKYWKVVEPETGDEVAKTNELEMPVMAGEYQLVWRQVEHGGQEIDLPKVVSVDSGQVTEVNINTGAQFIAPEGMDRPLLLQLLPNAADAERSAAKGMSPPTTALVSGSGPAGRIHGYPAPEGARLLRRQSRKMTFEEGKLTQVPLDQGLNLQWKTTTGRTSTIS